jgi:Domain of unknown function (DUF4265)
MADSDIVYVVHDDPVRRERRNYLVQVDLAPFDLDGQSEQLWLVPLDNGLYQVSCIPFCVEGLAFGDTVRLDEDRSIQEIVTPSGHRVLRALAVQFEGEPRVDEIVATIKATVTELGLLSEWRRDRHVAIDVPPGVPADRLLDLLEQARAGELFEYEWADVGEFRLPSGRP